MKCPKCNGPRSVTDSRYEGGRTRRRNTCQECKHRWTTYEVDEATLQKMAKIERREEFMELCQTELNKAYFRIMEGLKKLAADDAARNSDGPVRCEVVPFHTSKRGA